MSKVEKRKDERFVTSHGTGRQRKWFYSRVSFEDAVAQKQAWLESAGQLPARPGSICAFVESTYWERLRKTTEISTRKRYLQAINGYILPKIGRMLFAEVTLDDLLSIFEELSGENYRMVHSRLQSIFRLAHQMGLMELNLAPLVVNVPRKPKRKIEYTLERARAIEEAFAGTNMECAVWLALRLGLRRGEVLGIRPAEDFDHARKTLIISKQVTKEEGLKDKLKSKETGETREIPLPLSMWARLVAFADPNQLHLVPMTPNRLQKRFERIAKAKGWGITFHDLRTFASANMRRETDADSLTVRNVIGHSSEAVSAIYFDQHLESKRDAVAQLDKAYQTGGKKGTNVVSAED